jgi:hypothetical protein
MVNALADVGVVCRLATQPSIAVEAVEYRGNAADLPAEWVATGAFTTAGDSGLIVHTMAGPRLAEVGDFVLSGVGGDFYPLDAATFHDKYSQVSR